MKYEKPQMQEYFDSLPPRVQSFIEDSGADIDSLGELILVGEHFKNSLDSGIM